ncbi:hypothetical protein DF107_05820 [Burkholderia stagnalis]|nr:hypothetical protein DF161_03785 [Burkholderia stagnalis]RQY45488.1 hypothetical protein DF113_05435 [Burkholderia stagnalis]RQY84432.1 hypothetical protein DF107_05820 [Burkholderia stagnalis]
MVLAHFRFQTPLPIWYRAVDDFGNEVDISDLSWPWQRGTGSPLSAALAFIESEARLEVQP